jgi:hypothetical protein
MLAVHTDDHTPGPSSEMWNRLLTPWGCKSRSLNASTSREIDAAFATCLARGERVDRTRLSPSGHYSNPLLAELASEDYGHDSSALLWTFVRERPEGSGWKLLAFCCPYRFFIDVQTKARTVW